MYYKTTDTLYHRNANPVHPDNERQKGPVSNIPDGQAGDIVEENKGEPDCNGRPQGINNFYDTTNVLSS